MHAHCTATPFHYTKKSVLRSLRQPVTFSLQWSFRMLFADKEQSGKEQMHKQGTGDQETHRGEHARMERVSKVWDFGMNYSGSNPTSYIPSPGEVPAP